jgi:hypothetical protein
MSDTATHLAIPAGRLHVGIRDALLFAGRDDTLPMLTGVWLDWNGRNLAMAASDRYYVGRHTLTRNVPATDKPPTEPWRRFLKYELARALLVTIDSDQHTMHVEVEHLTVTVCLDNPADVGVLQVLDNALDKSLDKSLDNEPDSTRGITAIDAGRLARFTKLSERYGEPLRLRIGGRLDPVVVQVGDYFDGLVMPVKLTDSGRLAPKPSPCGDCDGPCGEADCTTSGSAA